MFDHLKAEAYSKLQREIINAFIASAVSPEYGSDYYSGRMSAFAEVLHIMRVAEKALNEEIECEAEKEAAYYEECRVSDESRSKQL